MCTSDCTIEIACQLYNQENLSKQVLSDNFGLLPHPIQKIYLQKAFASLQEEKNLSIPLTEQAHRTAKEDQDFITAYPENGDIDLSPYPLLSV